MTLNQDGLERPYPRTPEQVRGVSHDSHMTCADCLSLCRCKPSFMQTPGILCQTNQKCHCEQFPVYTQFMQHLVHGVSLSCMAWDGHGSPSKLHYASDGGGIGGRTGEDGPNKGVCAPVWMGYAAAAAQVQHLKPEVGKPLVCLLQCVVGVVCKELLTCGAHQGRWGRRGRGVRVCLAGSELVCVGSQPSLKWGR